MKYSEALSYLLNQLPMFQRVGKAAYKPGLENTYRLDGYFGGAHRHYRTIHVAGTNGKGSVSHMLASVLQQAGYKVGLYTSPHLLDFRERIKINGKVIDKKDVAEFVSRHKPYFDTFSPSFFEISVFMAFDHFMKYKVDLAVVEVGMGGKLDSTNIILPILSVITNIGKDHTEFLGKTYVKIAKEKAGIIKTGVPTVIGESRPTTRRVFSEIADRLHVPLVFADRQFNVDPASVHSDGYQVFDVKKRHASCYPELKCGLLGYYQQKNVITVLAATEILKESGFDIGEKNIYEGIRNVIRNTGLYGRWQVFSYRPVIVCDTAHNSEGIRQVMKQITAMNSPSLHVIIGFVSDKDLDRIFRYLPVKACYYFCRLSVPRTMDERKLQEKAGKKGLKGNSFPSVAEAFDVARKISGPDDIILITGSTFCVADFLGTFHSRHGKVRR